MWASPQAETMPKWLWTAAFAASLNHSGVGGAYRPYPRSTR